MLVERPIPRKRKLFDFYERHALRERLKAKLRAWNGTPVSSSATVGRQEPKERKERRRMDSHVTEVLLSNPQLAKIASQLGPEWHSAMVKVFETAQLQGRVEAAAEVRPEALAKLNTAQARSTDAEFETVMAKLRTLGPHAAQEQPWFSTPCTKPSAEEQAKIKATLARLPRS